MKPVRWTAHAETSLREREIASQEVDRTLAAPDRRLTSRSGREILVRRYEDEVLHQPMVLCVVVEDRPEETVVVTVYRSSKLQKYLAGGSS
jgi:hypothetical protein